MKKLLCLIGVFSIITMSMAFAENPISDPIAKILDLGGSTCHAAIVEASNIEAPFSLKREKIDEASTICSKTFSENVELQMIYEELTKVCENNSLAQKGSQVASQNATCKLMAALFVISNKY
ncbi:MAG: hypothetical protein ABIA04_14705 [Pseudomonadota bacterium]